MNFMCAALFRIFCLIVLFPAVSLSAAAPRQTLRDSLVSDFDTFISLLEQTHPDPYTRFGGKVPFHKQAYDLRLRLATQEHTVREFALLVSRFLSRLGDGHSYVDVPPLSDTSQERYLPVGISVVPQGLLLTKVPEKHKNRIGSRIVAVEGVPVGELAERTKQFAPVENLYGAYARLQGGLGRISSLKEILGRDEELPKVDFELLTPEGDEATLTLEAVSADALSRIETAELPAWSVAEGFDYMFYRFVDDRKRIMLFRLGSIMARENLTYMREVGRPSFRGELESFYRHTLRRPMPSDEDEALARVPSLAETFRAMLLEMKAAGATDLLIDLRGNGGGWTPIVYPTLYMLYGDEYLAKEMDAHLYHLISPLYLANRNVSLEAYNRLPKVDMDPFHPTFATDYKMGDYTFARPAAQSSEQTRNCFVRSAMGDVATLIGDLNGKPLYSPRGIYVLTDAHTYSAAFHYTFYLWKMGATLVGVPSSLATNTYMEGTPYRLPLTGIGGGFSNSLQVFLPQDDPRATVLYPDIMPDAADLRKYGFDKHTEILLLIDRIKGTSVRR